jgi:hypothetical protein
MTKRHEEMFAREEMFKPRMSPLQGITFKLERKIDTKNPCCENFAIVRVGKGPHSAELLCKRCGKHRGWMPREMTSWFLTLFAIFPEAARDVHVWRDATNLSALDLRRRHAKERRQSIEYDEHVVASTAQPTAEVSEREIEKGNSNE